MERGKRLGAAGFTLIELLVVVLIIGILAALAIPQYFKVVERARTGEALAFISAVKTSQERYNARFGQYAVSFLPVNPLDLSMANCPGNGAGPNCGMQNFLGTLGAGTLAAGCPSGYSVTATRLSQGAGAASNVSAAYAGYAITYDKCPNTLAIINNAQAQTDLAP